MKFKGRAHKFGNNVNTDEIIPARYLSTTDAKELAGHCMENIDADFAGRVKKGDIIVAGKNFGCGSSREHAPLSIKSCGAACVIASSFARIFYRNAINIGLPILESKEAASKIKEGDLVEINLAKGEIKNLSHKEIYRAQAFPEFMQELIKAGGLIKWVKSQIANRKPQITNGKW